VFISFLIFPAAVDIIRADILKKEPDGSFFSEHLKMRLSQGRISGGQICRRFLPGLLSRPPVLAGRAACPGLRRAVIGLCFFPADL
jgi:hypothetical protein